MPLGLALLPTLPFLLLAPLHLVLSPSLLLLPQPAFLVPSSTSFNFSGVPLMYRLFSCTASLTVSLLHPPHVCPLDSPLLLPSSPELCQLQLHLKLPPPIQLLSCRLLGLPSRELTSFKFLCASSLFLVLVPLYEPLLHPL
ncbi:hypothetical protein C8Q80DRAFT_1271534 [Daedaleopsis nitida]|nr:hypothetical protein C8Q80DRAFT_1271534 [Daedaleopsis nitida]